MNVLTIGFLCQMTQRSPAELERAIQELKINPTLTINQRRHFSEHDIERLINFFRGGSTEPQC